MPFFSFRKFIFHSVTLENTFHYPRLIQSSSLQQCCVFFSRPLLSSRSLHVINPLSSFRGCSSARSPLRFCLNSRDLPTPCEELFALSLLSLESHPQCDFRRWVPCFLNDLFLLSFLPPKGISSHVSCFSTTMVLKLDPLQGRFVLLLFCFYFVTRYV